MGLCCPYCADSKFPCVHMEERMKQMQTYKPLTNEDLDVILMALRTIEFSFPNHRKHIMQLIQRFGAIQTGRAIEVPTYPEEYMYTEGEKDETS